MKWGYALVSCLSFMMYTISPCFGAFSDWETPPDQVSESGILANQPILIVNGSRTLCTWVSGDDGTFEQIGIIKAAYSDDDGATWSASSTLSSIGDNSNVYPAMGAVSNYVFVAWQNITSGAILSNFSSDNGVTWLTTPVTLYDGLSGSAFNARIAITGNDPLVDRAIAVWYGKIPGNPRFQVSVRSAPINSPSWSPVTYLSSLAKTGFACQVAAQGNSAVAVFQDTTNFSIQSANSTDHGLTWPSNSPTRVIPNLEQGIIPQVAISKDGTRALCVWQRTDIFPSTIRSANSSTNVLNWSATPSTLSSPLEYSTNPQVYINSNDVAFCVWEDNSYHIRLAYSDDFGDNWTTVTVYSGGIHPTLPRLAIFENTLICEWIETINPDVVLRSSFSIDGGKTWSTAVTVPDSFQGPDRFFLNPPQIAFNSNGETAITAWHGPGLGTITSILATQSRIIPTALNLTCSQNPSIENEPVTFTATIIPTSTETLTPSGVVTFFINGNPLGDPMPVNNFQATSISIGNLLIGSYSIRAEYSGDMNFHSSLITCGHKVINLLPPQNLREKCCRKALKNKIVHILKWDPPSLGITPAAYKIFRNADLTEFVAVVFADEKLEYIDRHCKSKHRCSYFIVSVDDAGNFSSPAGIIVNCKKCKECKEKKHKHHHKETSSSKDSSK